MPKEVKEDVKTPKKKMVVVEEVVEDVEAPKINNVPTEAEVSKDEIKSDSTSKPDSEMDSELSEDKTSYLWIIVPTALLIGALVGGLITYFSGLSRLNEVNSLPSPVASVTPEVKVTATPSPKAEIDRGAIKLQVLNGSGVSGEASQAKIFLESLGYKSVVIGNASKSYTETIISLKSDKKDLLETIGGDLSKKYEIAQKTETLPASSKYDFVITLGSKQSLTR